MEFGGDQMNGILIFETDNIIAKDNTIRRYKHGIYMGSWGMQRQSVSENKILNNTMVDCQYGISLRIEDIPNYLDITPIATKNVMADNFIEAIYPQNVKFGIELLVNDYRNDITPIMENNVISNNIIIGYDTPIKTNNNSSIILDHTTRIFRQ